MKKLLPPLFAALLALPADAADDGMRLEKRLLFRNPELSRPGSCVMYREGGAGWIVTEPVYWLKGTTLSAEVRKRKLARCPEVAGKTLDMYSRDEFVHLAKARPCVAQDSAVREEDVAVIRLRVSEWETPWAKRAANAGRLYQGHYLATKLAKNLELEIDADLLQSCSGEH